MKKLKQNLDELLKAEYKNWKFLFTYGGQDPFWADGCNMNLVRNHIINTKKQMEDAGQLTNTYYIELPPEVDNDYMARADDIRANARRSLDAYKKNEDYLYLLDAVGSLDQHQIKATSINNVIGYVRGLEYFIEHDDLVSMRRHEDADRYIESFTECRQQVENLMKEKKKVFFHEDNKQMIGQLSIIDLFSENNHPAYFGNSSEFDEEDEEGMEQ